MRFGEALAHAAKEKVKAEGMRSLKDRIELEGVDMNSAYPKVVN